MLWKVWRLWGIIQISMVWLSILFKACLFNLTFYKGSHSKGLKQKSTACASKKNKTFHRKAFSATFHGSTDHFEKYAKDCPQSANLKSISEAFPKAESSQEEVQKPSERRVESFDTPEVGLKPLVSANTGVVEMAFHKRESDQKAPKSKLIFSF